MDYKPNLMGRIRKDKDKTRLNPSKGQALQAAVASLQQLFNIRQGSCPLHPRLGLPDFNDMLADNDTTASGFGEDVDQFKLAMKRICKEIEFNINEFAPQFERAKVKSVFDRDQPLTLRFEIRLFHITDNSKDRINLISEKASDDNVKVQLKQS